ncbi:MAG: hypothetical protein HKM03_04120 [Steroidobacteraceae bacterium]|nr:hypothetical protein [Steroidobacteraceae bacterium]
MTVNPRWLLISAAVSVAAVAAGTGTPRTTPPRSASAQRAAPADALLEFLGQDDIPDQKWWEFMKRKAPDARSRQPARQDSKP